MEAVRDAWTDERLDDLNHRVDNGFRKSTVNFRRCDWRCAPNSPRCGRDATEFAAVRAEMAAEFDCVARSRAASEMAAMNRTLIQVGAGAMVTMFVGFAATIATVLTQT